MIELKTPGEIETMRAAGIVVADALAAVRAEAAVGVSLTALDQVARDVLADAGASSPFLGYRPGRRSRAETIRAETIAMARRAPFEPGEPFAWQVTGNDAHQRASGLLLEAQPAPRRQIKQGGGIPILFEAARQQSVAPQEAPVTSHLPMPMCSRSRSMSSIRCQVVFRLMSAILVILRPWRPSARPLRGQLGLQQRGPHAGGGPVLRV